MDQFFIYILIYIYIYIFSFYFAQKCYVVANKSNLVDNDADPLNLNV